MIGFSGGQFDSKRSFACWSQRIIRNAMTLVSRFRCLCYEKIDCSLYQSSIKLHKIAGWVEQRET